ncbi:MAG: hypothetical protein NVS9B10_28110 [Nevskia sp.]
MIAPRALAGALAGLATAAGFWSGEAATPLAGARFRHAEIPVDAVPEQVLDRLATLRGV